MTKLPLLINIPQKSVIISAAGNAITSMDFDEEVQYWNEFHRMAILNLHNNSLKLFKTVSLKKYFPRITTLILSYNKITHLKMSLAATLESLKELDLSNNYIHFIEEKIFNKMKQLTYLNLNGNKISILHRYTLEGLNHLVKLDMRNNQITNINMNLFKNTRDLLHLDMQNNSISSWQPENSTWPIRLSVINLSFNRIRQIPPLPPALLSNKESFLNLDGNPTFCGCRSPGFDHSVFKIEVMCKISITCDSLIYMNTNRSTCDENATRTVLNHIVRQNPCRRPQVFAKLQYLLFESTINCSSVGYPTPVVSLRRSDHKISVLSSQKGAVISKMDTKVLFADICANVSYKCRAENEIGETEQIIDLDDVSSAQLDTECKRLSFAQSKPVMSKTTITLVIFSTTFSGLTVCFITFRIYICRKRSIESEDNSSKSPRSSNAEYEQIELQVTSDAIVTGLAADQQTI